MWLSPMPAKAFAFRSNGNVRHVMRCWWRWLCARISGRNFGGAQFNLRTDHSSLWWLHKVRNGNGMLAHWYMLLGQYSVTFEYRPGAQHANADGMSRQCGQCTRPDCPVSSSDSWGTEVDATTVLLDQPFASSEMGDSMDTDLLPELSGETWVAATLLDEHTADLPPAGSDLDLIVASRQDVIRVTVLAVADRESASGYGGKIVASPGSSVGDLSARGTRWEHQDIIRRSHDSLFAGHLGVSRTVYRLLDQVYWPGLCQDVCSYLASCAVCLARKSPCPRRAPMGHVDVGHRWDRVAMDLAVADAFFQHIVCRFGMPSVIHSDPGQLPEECFPHNTPSFGLTNPLCVSFASGVTILSGEPPLKQSPDILIHDPVCPDITEEDKMDIVSVETDVPIHVLRQGFGNFHGRGRSGGRTVIHLCLTFQMSSLAGFRGDMGESRLIRSCCRFHQSFRIAWTIRLWPMWVRPGRSRALRPRPLSPHRLSWTLFRSEWIPDLMSCPLLAAGPGGPLPCGTFVIGTPLSWFRVHISEYDISSLGLCVAIWHSMVCW